MVWGSPYAATPCLFLKGIDREVQTSQKLVSEHEVEEIMCPDYPKNMNHRPFISTYGLWHLSTYGHLISSTSKPTRCSGDPGATRRSSIHDVDRLVHMSDFIVHHAVDAFVFLVPFEPSLEVARCVTLWYPPWWPWRMEFRAEKAWKFSKWNQSTWRLSLFLKRQGLKSSKKSLSIH